MSVIIPVMPALKMTYFVGIDKIPQRVIGLVLRTALSIIQLGINQYFYGKIADYYLGISIPDVIVHVLCTEYTSVIVLGILPLMQGFLIPHSGWRYSAFRI